MIEEVGRIKLDPKESLALDPRTSVVAPTVYSPHLKPLKGE
jgi:hypothetical protein